MARTRTTNDSIGEALRQARLYRGLTQAELAHLMGVKSSSVVSIVETATSNRAGRRTERVSGIGVATLHRFAQALHITLTLTPNGTWVWTPLPLNETSPT